MLHRTPWRTSTLFWEKRTTHGLQPTPSMTFSSRIPIMSSRNRPAMLKHLYTALKPNGRLVVLELYSTSHKNDSRAEQVKRHDISPDILEQELSAAGFVIKERIDG